MKLLNFCFVLVVLCGVFEKSHGTDLNCEFGDEYFSSGTYYSCYVSSLVNINNNMVITGYSGTPSKNVEAIYIFYTNTKYIPKDLGLLFNLSALTITSSQLVEIKSEDFNNMKNLVELYLSSNLLEDIPNGVFSNNPELKKISLWKNKIKFIGSSVFDELTKLNYVDLWSNICISKRYRGSSTEIIQLKNDIKLQCKSPYEVKMALTTNLECQFEIKKIYFETYYSCYVTSLDNSINNTVITKYTGSHQSFQTDSDVRLINIDDTNTKYIPGNLGVLFNLTALRMLNTQLVEIKSLDFIGMENLKYLDLDGNKLTSIPIDAFSTLPKLTRIDLRNNQIEEIPNEVFSNNLQLVKIYLEQNKIKFIGSTLFVRLIKLNYVDLKGNICINDFYKGNRDIIELKNDIKSQCINPNENGTMNTIEILFYEIDDQKSRVKEELKTEFVARTEEQQKKFIEMLTEAAEAEEMEEEEYDDYCEILKCNFKDFGYSIGTFYSCDVTSLVNSNNSMVINGSSGTHLPNKTDAFVKGIYIHNTNTKYIPRNLGNIFNLNISVLSMIHTQLVEIESQNFIGMENLEELTFYENKLTSIPLDVFSKLSKLKVINLDLNQIEEIPNGVFSNNLQLDTISLWDNKIKYFGSSVFDGLTKLNYVSLESNICINKYYSGSTAIIQLKNYIKSQCKSPYEVKMALTTNPIELFLFNGQMSRLKNELLTEFVVETEEHQKKLIEMLTEATEGEEMEESYFDW